VTVKDHLKYAGPGSTPSFNRPQDSPSVHLDALRGFAALSVMLSHWRGACFSEFSNYSIRNPVLSVCNFFAGLGHQWVIVFFVLSGYLVGGSVLRSMDSGRWSWRGYLTSRLTRLYVVLLPALLLGGAIDWAGMHMARTGYVYNSSGAEHVLYREGHYTLTLPTMVANGLFLQNIALPGRGGERVTTFGSNGVLWSLSNEFWYYIAFPLLVLALANSRSWAARAGYGVALVVLGWFIGLWMVIMGIPWLMGVILHYLPPLRARGALKRSAWIALAMLMLVGALVLGFVWNSLMSDLILGVIVTFLIWVILNCTASRLPSGYIRIAQRSARSSYTLYLVHVPFLVFLKAYLHLPNSISGWPKFAVSIALLVAVLLYAQLVYQLFERNTDGVRAWINGYPANRQAAKA